MKLEKLVQLKRLLREQIEVLENIAKLTKLIDKNNSSIRVRVLQQTILNLKKIHKELRA